MSDTVTLNRGSDLVFEGAFTDEAGPIDLTGAVLSVFEPHPALAPNVFLAVTNAASGVFSCTIKWDTDLPHGIVMPLRIRLLQGSLATAWPPINLRVGA